VNPFDWAHVGVMLAFFGSLLLAFDLLGATTLHDIEARILRTLRAVSPRRVVLLVRRHWRVALGGFLVLSALAVIALLLLADLLGSSDPLLTGYLLTCLGVVVAGAAIGAWSASRHARGLMRFRRVLQGIQWLLGIVGTLLIGVILAVLVSVLAEDGAGHVNWKTALAATGGVAGVIVGLVLAPFALVWLLGFAPLALSYWLKSRNFVESAIRLHGVALLGVGFVIQYFTV
jgi:hypothetical protein